MSAAWRLGLPAACLLAAACGSAGSGDLRPTPAPSSSASPPATRMESGPGDPAAPAGGDSVGDAETEANTRGNRIRWKTASEVDNFGYNVFRGESPDGPFVRINPEVIDGAGTTDVPTAYVYVDRAIDPRKTYYYYVESVSMGGVRERFTPIERAPPKIAEPGDDAPNPGEEPAPVLDGPGR